MNKATVPRETIAGVGEDSTTCPQCGAPTRLDYGTCINCLLHEEIETKGQTSRETFESILSEADIADKQWRLGHYETLEEIRHSGIEVEA